jgi:hypothetical protein
MFQDCREDDLDQRLERIDELDKTICLRMSITVGGEQSTWTQVGDDLRGIASTGARDQPVARLIRTTLSDALRTVSR